MKDLETPKKNQSVIHYCVGTKTVACQKETDEKVSAEEVTKEDGPFYCDECDLDVIVKKCSEKKDHFAHLARLSPIATNKDYALHNSCRDEICAALQLAFPEGEWVTEYTMKTANNNREIRPDIYGLINGKKIAIEVQASAYTIAKIANKTKDYNDLGIAVFWVVPLKEDIGDRPFRPRLFEKYLHSLYFGRTYYYTQGSGSKIQAIHYSFTKRWKEGKTWFDEEGQEQSSSSYYATYKGIKVANLGDILDIITDFSVRKRKGFAPKNIKKEIPDCVIFGDNLSKWWEEDEYKNKKKQMEIQKDDEIYSTNKGILYEDAEEDYYGEYEEEENE